MRSFGYRNRLAMTKRRRQRSKHLQRRHHFASSGAKHLSDIGLTEQLVELEGAAHAFHIHLELGEPGSVVAEVFREEVEVALATKGQAVDRDSAVPARS